MAARPANNLPPSLRAAPLKLRSPGPFCTAWRVLTARVVLRVVVVLLAACVGVTAPAAAPSTNAPGLLLRPDSPHVAGGLQIWLRADSLPTKDGALVYRWPDASGQHRDASPTAGVHDGAGTPPTFVRQSLVNGRPAVRFSRDNGLGTPGDRPVNIQGDAAFTVFVVATLKYQEGASHDVVVGFGEPLLAANTSPGRPGAGLLEIDRTGIGRHRLDLAGGFMRDAKIGRPGSFASFYGQPQILTLTKRPGPMRDTVALFVNGEPIDTVPAAGTTAVPDIRQRADFSVFLGHAFPPTGALDGDIAEVGIYNTALEPATRSALERHLAAKYGIQLSAPEAGPGPDLVSAEDREHWAFRRAVRPVVPKVAGATSGSSVSSASGQQNPIDAFLLEKLRARGLTFSPEANPATLVRRLYFDVVGLPPSPAEVAQYLADPSAAAYDQLVDRLLQSRHFGERWGRHWLDMAGYVDVTGNDQNAEQIILGTSKWRYRDYIIRAFNDDKPWDQALLEQIAGDELVDWRAATDFPTQTQERLIATGYLRTAIDDTHEVDLNKVPFRYQVVYDTVQIVGNSLFALTLQCARCHNHKYDPIPQQDYYRFMGLFTPALNPYAWLQPKDREVPNVAPAEQAAIQQHNAGIERQVKALQESIAAGRTGASNRLWELRLTALPAPEREEIRSTASAPAGKRSEAQQELLKQHKDKLKIAEQEIEAAFTSDERDQTARSKAEIQRLNRGKRSWEDLRAFFEAGPPLRDCVFVRGDHEQPGKRVNPGFLSVLCRSGSEAILPPQNAAAGPSSGRRLAFARWVTDTNSAAAALTSRVLLNRFWQQLFGQGLAPTSDNFGRNGLRPTHPELLDWLACEFMDSGWRIKRMVRLLLTSQAYRQASTRPELAEPAAIDPENRLLWRQQLRRLESEIIRDAMLAVSGTLDSTMFGPAVPLINLPDGSAALAPDDKMPTPTSKWRRSLYLMNRRNFHLPILGSFDQPIINTSCARRLSSSVVLQPLTMLNDAFVLEQAGFLADRVTSAAPSTSSGQAPDPRAQVDSLFLLALSRQPAAEEMQWSLEFLADQNRNFRAGNLVEAQAGRRALEALCQMLLNTSEFLYLN